MKTDLQNEASLSRRLNSLLSSLDGVDRDFEPNPVWLKQPLHTVYVPADRVDRELSARWREQAVSFIDACGGLQELADIAGIPAELREAVCQAAARKLDAQVIEDLRIDYEDGYGYRKDAEEDTVARNGGKAGAQILLSEAGPDRVGLRIKPFDSRGAHRSVRTLRLFLESFLSVPGARERVQDIRVTFAKVMRGIQMTTLDQVCKELEHVHRLEEGAIGVELQVEVPQVIAQGEGEDSLLALASNPRVRALHFGTYDYTSAQGIFPGEQRSNHPVALHAKRVMQVVAACHEIEVCDGSSNLIPLGNLRARAVKAHSVQISSALRDGIPQGWDLHPMQLPTRYLVSFAALRAEVPNALRRLHNAASQEADTGVLDEPATLRMLAAVIIRSLRVGALGEQELVGNLTRQDIEKIALTGALASSTLASAVEADRGV